MKDSRFIAVLGFFGLVLFFLLYLEIAPAARLDLQVNRNEALDLARSYLKSQTLSVEGFAEYADLALNQKMVSYLNSRDVKPNLQKRIEEHRPYAAWEVIFRHPARNERYHLLFSPQGEIFDFEHILPPEIAGGQLEFDTAKEMARQFLTDHLQVELNNFQLESTWTHKHDNRTDYIFDWQRNETTSEDAQLRMWVKVTGDKIGGWRRHVVLPNEIETAFEEEGRTQEMFEFGIQLFAISIFFIALVVFVLRFRAGEVSVRNAMLFTFLTLIATLALVINLFPTNEVQRLAATDDNSEFFQIMIFVVIALAAFWSSVSVFFVWASGESLTRELWPEKLKVFDGLFARKFFFPGIGKGIVRGFAVASIQLGLLYSLYWLVLQSGRYWLTVTSSDGIYSATEQQALASLVPIGLPFIIGIQDAVMTISFSLLFMVAFLRRLLKNTSVAVALTLLLTHIIFGGIIHVLNDTVIQTAIFIIVGSLTYFAYFKYDLFTAFISIIFFSVLPFAMLFFSQPDASYQLAGLTSFALTGIILVFGLIATRARPIDEKQIAPHYTRFITERERLKTELDIARKAQLRMLPQAIPQVSGIDIAAFSEPAKEVGGDYFDFVQYDDKRLGVVIGDVSGKGMPAALYMTLTKGFLRALAASDNSPKDVLCRINRYFYQSADSNIFISLFYGILDPVSKTLISARAGHNPILLHHRHSNTTMMIKSSGIAIGLEKGTLFDQVIVEEKTNFEAGDIFVFYTDGLTEGMNASKEEFGEQRLLDLIQSSSQLSAEELLNLIRTEHKNFCGRQEPHDDLTCIVIKVL